jgi:cell division protein FtsL
MRLKSLPRIALGVVVPLLWLAVLGSAAGAVWCKYRSREQFVELERLNRGRDEYEAEWGRLQLEQSSWSTYAYVESVAGSRLHMKTPPSGTIEIVQR